MGKIGNAIWSGATIVFVIMMTILMAGLLSKGGPDELYAAGLFGGIFLYCSVMVLVSEFLLDWASTIFLMVLLPVIGVYLALDFGWFG